MERRCAVIIDGAVASRPLHRAADFNPLAVRREAPSINGSSGQVPPRANPRVTRR